MFGELDLILLFKFNIVLDEVVGPIFRLFAALLILSAKLQFVQQGHLDYLMVVNHLLLLIQVHLLEVGPVLVSA
jgi:hypothetical protein